MKRPVVKILCCLLAIIFPLLTTQAQSRSYTIQVESSPTEAEAKAGIAQLQAKGVEAYWVKATVPGKGVRYRIRIGKFKSQAEAKAKADRLLGSRSIKEYIVTFYDTPSSSDSIATGATGSTSVPGSTGATGATGSPGALASLGESKPAAPPRAVPERTVAKTDLPPKTGPAPAPPRPATEKSTPTLAELISESGAKKAHGVKPEQKLEAKPEPKPEAKLEAKLEPAPPAPEKSPKDPPRGPEAESMIASPAMAAALADVTINNASWKVVRRTAETDKNLRAVYFVDSLTGWAAGDAGAVYRTTDGGKSWKPLLSGSGANINFIYFFDWNNGWMLGESGGGMAEEPEGDTVLFITTNGGRAWTRKSLPNVTSLYFTSPKTGWAVGRNATLLKTTDGGLGWKKVEGMEKLIGLTIDSTSYNFGFSDIFFTDAEHGWLIGNFYGRARSNIGGIFNTTDGGLNWRRVAVTFQPQRPSERFTPGLLHSVRFTDVNTGSVTGEMYDGDGRFFFAMHTRNAGLTWDQTRVPSRATHSTQFLDPATGWTAAFAPREGAAEAVVYDTTLMRTDNGGASWRNDFIARGRRIRGVFFISPTRGWAVGDRGVILCYDEKPKTN